MIFNDVATRQGVIQGCEDTCGLGAAGITGNASLFQQFVRWTNAWHKVGFAYAIQAFDGHDIDDPNWTTLPTGTFTGATTRDYYFSGTHKFLKIKAVNISYDGTNYVVAKPFDMAQRTEIAAKDPNVDAKFNQTEPYYDLFADGLRIYPTFSTAEVTGGAKIYVEWMRGPRDYATTGTDDYEVGIASPFQHLVVLGPSYEYSKLYKPDLAAQLRLDIYGNGGNIKGVLKEIDLWYKNRQPQKQRIIPLYQDNK